MVSVVGVNKSLHAMDHSGEDPVASIKKAVGDIEGLKLSGVQVLIGTYVRPQKTKGGIILSEKFRDEDFYQGKVGLVLKLAPGAFVDGPDAKFNGFKVEPGDWVFFRVADGFSLSLNGHHCRILEDVHVRGWLPHPDMVN